MTTIFHPRRAFPLAASALIFAGLPALGQPEKNNEAKPKAPPPPVLVAERAGAADFIVDAKDANLKKALGMLPARIRELPRELPGMDAVPLPALDVLINLITSPARLAVTFNSEDQSRGGFGAGVILSFGPMDQNAASQMHGTIGALLAGAHLQGEGHPAKAYPSMTEMAVPIGGVLQFGPRQADGGSRYEVHVGSFADPDSVFTSLPAPAMPGFTPTIRARLDLSPLEPLANMLAQMAAGAAGEAPEMALANLKKAGLFGPDSLKWVLQHGFTKDERVGFIITQNSRKHAQAMNALPTPLTAAELGMIPIDATVAAIQKIPLDPMREALKKITDSQPQVAQALAQFKQATGVDLVDDVLGTMGGTFGLYMSDSTRGSLGSLVLLASLSDRPRFEQAHAKLMALANAELSKQSTAKGYIRIRPWQDGDIQLFSINFPGLPVPLELTYALKGNWLIAGITPQATLAAARQAEGAKGGKGIRDNPAFRDAIGGKEILSFSFIDTPRTMRDGYQYVSLAGSALANAVRSPTDSARDPGLIVPTYGELKAGARPMVSFSYWRGEDRVSESHSDRSMLVNAAGAVGAAAPFFPVIGALIGGAAAGAKQQQHLAPHIKMPTHSKDAD